MGIPLNQVPQHYFPLMSSEDQERFGGISTAPDPQEEVHPEAKRGSAEGDEQGQFAAWLKFRRAEGIRLPVIWHGMHKRSTSTRGTPDFVVGVNGTTLYIEFKRDYGCKLSPSQEEFRLDCGAQNCIYRVVYSAGAAIELVRNHMSLSDLI